MIDLARLLSLLALCLLTSAAAAQAPGPRLTDQGRLLIAGSLGGWWQHEGSERWSVWVEPAVSYFLRDHIALGGYVAYRESHSHGLISEDRRYEVGLQSTNEVPLDDNLGVVFIAKLGYARRDTAVPDPHPVFPGLPDAAQATETAFQQPFGHDIIHLGLHIPFLYHVNPHVGVGIGPELSVDFDLSAKVFPLRVGVTSLLAISI